MNVAEFEQFQEGVAGVYAFYGKEVSGFAMDVWWNAMGPYDLAAVRDAFNRHLMNPDSGQFLPKPADIVKMLGGRTEDRALVAWAKVDKAVRSVGNYSSVVFDDPLIHRCIAEMGGWIGLGQKTEDEWPFVGKEFQTRYRGYAMRGDAVRDYQPILIGISEAYNQQKGFKIDPPRLVGNMEKAKQVMLGGSDAPAIGVHDCGRIALRAINGGRS